VNDVGPLLERVRFTVFDLDGVFTDNRVSVNEREEMRASWEAQL
jgi:3-deoxy-D-manno-octulosonate 8-phosphate phosphatase KdsC-like HAD superfamily phosphatase